MLLDEFCVLNLKKSTNKKWSDVNISKILKKTFFNYLKATEPL